MSVYMRVDVDLDDFYSEMDSWDKTEMVKKLARDGFLEKKGYLEIGDIEKPNPMENLDDWEVSIYKLSKVKQYSVSNEDMEIISKIAKKYYL